MKLLVDGKPLKVNVHYRNGFNPEEVQKHVTACRMLEEAVNSEEFYVELMKRKFSSTMVSNMEIYDKIMSGAETLEPDVDFEIDVYAEMYHSVGKVVGYTKPNTLKTWVNRKFFNHYSYAEVAGNIFHEWLHKVGYGHSSAKDHTSVPYALGYIMEALIVRLMNGEKFTPINSDYSFPRVEVQPEKILVCYRSWKTLFRKVCYYKVSA